MATCGKDYYFLGEQSNEEQANSIADYLPDDETFVSKNVSGTNTRTMLEVFSKQLTNFEEIVNVFTNEMSPECADQLMGEWENMLGIPDDCYKVEGVSLTDRRRNALIKLAKMNVQTNEDFTILAEAFNITATVQSGIDYSNETGYVFAGGDTEARFTIVITFINNNVEKFTFTFPITFGLEILDLLECVFSKVKPANCNVLFFTDTGIIGLYDGTTIGATTPPNDILATRLNDTDGEIIGDEGLIARGKVYTDVSIVFGEKKYIEFSSDNIVGSNNFVWVGLEVTGGETPANDTGQNTDQIGFSKGGATYIEGVFNGSGSSSFTDNDVIGMTIDYTAQTVIVELYINDSIVSSNNLLPIPVSTELRASYCMGIQTDIGGKGSIFTSDQNQTYTAPSGFDSLE